MDNANTKSGEKSGHLVAQKDRRRIGCQTNGCRHWAFACEYSHWNTGNTTGVSFFYHCRRHTAPALAATLEASR